MLPKLNLFGGIKKTNQRNDIRSCFKFLFFHGPDKLKVNSFDVILTFSFNVFYEVGK